MDPIAEPHGRRHPGIEWGLVSRAMGDGRDGVESGDLYVIIPFHDGSLVAVIDGLGHGPEAAAAAKAAARILESDAAASLSSLIQRCHEGLRRTRGVVMSLASFSNHDSSMTWAGVGNVEGMLVRADPTATPRREAFTTRSGVIGYQLPSLRPEKLVVSTGDMLVMVTDGIQSAFRARVSHPEDPQGLADAIMADYRKESDDALVLVARYVGIVCE
jgi:phosphoserine phosphatase RsbX